MGQEPLEAKEVAENGVAKALIEVAQANEGKVEVNFRTGEARKELDPKEPVKVSIKGVLNTPLRWLEKRITLIDQKKCHLLVDREIGTLVLIVQEKDHYQDVIEGKLLIDPTYKKFGINENMERDNFKLADFFKMHRSYFEEKDVANSLVYDLKNFKAKINAVMEKADNNRGDKTTLRQQTVESNLPDKFRLNLPVLKGYPRKAFEVEVYVDAETFSCSLISPDAAEILQNITDVAFDDVLDGIKLIAPELVIIEK